MKKIVFFVAASLLLLPACGKIREENLKREDLTEPVPIVLTTAEQSVRNASNDFGLDVFGKLCALSGGKDVAFSPLSL